MKNNYDDDVLELLKKIQDDCLKIRKLRIEISKMERGERKEVKQDNNIEEDDNFEEKEEDISEFEDEVAYYLNIYQNLDDSFTRGDLLDAIPSVKHYQFREIIRRLQAESIKEIKEINEIIILDSDELSCEELEEYQKLILKEKRKIDILNELLSKKKIEVEEEEINNKLILVPTLSGNIRLLDELSHIPKDFYPAFLELIHSIEDGTFKRVKRFTNHRDLVGINEVKGHQVRVVFKRLGSDTYALITAFLKKCNNDKLYKESLCSKVNDYKMIEDRIVSLLQDDTFIEENDKNVEDLKKLLSSVREKRNVR